MYVNIFNVDIEDLGQHILYMIPCMFNAGIDDLCEHRIYLLEYVFNVDRGDFICWHTYTMLV